MLERSPKDRANPHRARRGAPGRHGGCMSRSTKALLRVGSAPTPLHYLFRNVLPNARTVQILT
jgi:hypothetical protein